ncbi:MAG: fibrobacter succinogenes major paralogous domain-containing protein [Fibromonadales bacterium]|nr:fibrobacter succinogenes major paralogous domain-containing protein [Fibromonadales bacterium]
MSKYLFIAIFSAAFYLGCTAIPDDLKNPSGDSQENNVSYQGQTYKTVKIGDQIWMAENLNYAVNGSKCYDNLESNCDTYGRLYDWATAMNLPSYCNSNSCSSPMQSPHRGICPEGWHIPSNADWDKLYRYANGTTGTTSCYDSQTASKYLKATSGWNEEGNGTDDYGFSALPGGIGYSGGSFFDNVDYFGYWWSASEQYSEAYDASYYRYISYHSEYDGWRGSGFKDYFLAVRCIKNLESDDSNSSPNDSGSSSSSTTVIISSSSGSAVAYNLYFLPPSNPEWTFGSHYLVWIENGSLKREKLGRDSRCGWFKKTWSNTTPPNGVTLIFLNGGGANEFPDDQLGLYGLEETQCDWIDGNPTPFNLLEQFNNVVGGLGDLFFIPDGGKPIWSRTDQGKTGVCSGW